MISDNHRITPSIELIYQWVKEVYPEPGKGVHFIEEHVATQSARWGADQQLAICLNWLQDHGYDLEAPELQEHCRPSKPQPPQTVVIDGHTYHLAK